MYKKISEELIDFIKNSPTAFHAIDNISKRLKENGYEELLEGRRWNIKAGGKYFVTRNNSSIIALNIGTKLDNYSFNVAASHSDSPTFKIKENAEIEVRGKYTKLNTEGYGGMLCSTWFDRPLSIAGRVLVKEDDTYVAQLVDIDRDLVMIPNVAIHMNRKINDGYAYNKQVDMLPLFGGSESKPGDFNKLIAEKLGVQEENIYGSDLYLYNRMAPSIWGANEEFISSPKLDDLQCAFTSLEGFLKGSNEQSINVFACFDNEEVYLAHDDTLFKNGRNGFAITEEGIYCREFMGEYTNYVTFEELAKAKRIYIDGSNIYADDELIAYLSGSNSEKNDLKELFETIAMYVGINFDI